MRQTCRSRLHSVARSLAAVIVASAMLASGVNGTREASAQSASQKGPHELPPTRMRTASWILLGTGGAAIAGGIALGVLSVIEIRKLRELNQAADNRTLSEQQRRAHDAATSARDDYRLGSGIAAGAGLGLFLLGGALLVLDGSSAPSHPGPGPKGSEPYKVKGRESPASRAGVSAFPLVGPGFAGAMLAFRF